MADQRDKTEKALPDRVLDQVVESTEDVTPGAEPADETVKESPAVDAAPAVPDVSIKSVADEDIAVSVAAGDLAMAPGKEYEVSAEFAEQAEILDSVERV